MNHKTLMAQGPVECRVMRHMPGPWRVMRQNHSPTTGEWMITGSKPGYLAEVRDCGSGDVNANAKLIAAAPDLLQALQYAVGQVPELATVPGVAAALAMATGHDA